MNDTERIEFLEEALNNLLNDCINFDGGKLTDVFMEDASRVLKLSKCTSIEVINE